MPKKLSSEVVNNLNKDVFIYIKTKFGHMWGHDAFWIITNSDLNKPCFAWRPYGKSGLFKTELVIV